MRDLEDYARRGDYLIPRSTLDEAERVFSRRSERSQAVDRAMRGSITTDFEKWKRTRGRGADYPGIDTPSDHPRVAPIDHLSMRERARVAAKNPRVGGDALLVEQPVRGGKRDVSDYIGAAADETWRMSGRFANILSPGSAEDAY